MKKAFALILALVIVLTVFCSCGKKADTSAADTYLSMAQDFLDKNDVDSAIDILNKGFAETKDAQLSEKLVEIYAQRDNTEATEPSSTETQTTTATEIVSITTTPTTKTKTTTPPTTKPTTATTAATKNTQSASSNVTPEFKKAMDSYEKFFDEYIAFMKAFEKSDNVLDLMDDYNKYLKQYAETVQKMSEIKTDKLSAADYAYYFEVNGRITKKLLEVATTPSAPSSALGNSGQSTESKVDRYAAAVEEAIKQADRWFPTDRHFVKYKLQVDGLEPFTETEAEYAIQNANIDWKKHALQTAKDLLEDNIGSGVSQNDIRFLVESCGGADCGCAGFTEEELQYAVDNFGIDWKSKAINEMKEYWNNDYSVIVTYYDFYDYLADLGYDEDIIQYALDNTSGYYRGEATASEEERVKLLLSYGYTREAIINWYSEMMDYSEAEALVDSCIQSIAMDKEWN